MKVDPHIAAVRHDRLQNVEPHDQTTWQLAWRRELERAQRSQKQPTESHTATAPKHWRSQFGDTALTAQSREGAIEDLPGSTPQLEPVMQIPVTATPPTPSSVDERQSASVLSGPEAPSESSVAPAANSEHAFEAHELPARAAPPIEGSTVDALVARMERLAWMPRAAHVSLQGDEVTVALRDANLTEREAKDIFWRVRKEVRSLGFELAGLVVNGSVVTPAGE